MVAVGVNGAVRLPLRSQVPDGYVADGGIIEVNTVLLSLSALVVTDPAAGDDNIRSVREHSEASRVLRAPEAELKIRQPVDGPVDGTGVGESRNTRG